MALDKSHLWKRGNTYSAVVEVPQALWSRLGTRRFVKALGTGTLAEANKRKLPFIMEWKRRIETARSSVADPHALVMAAAMEFRAAFVASDLYHDHERGASNTEELLGVINEEAGRLLEEQGRAAADSFLAVATGRATLVRDTYETWLGQFEGTEQTKVQHKAAVERYLEWAKAVTIEETTRKKAGEYVNSLLATSGLSRRTIQRHCSSMSSLWVWYHARGYLETEANPWKGHGLAGKKGKAPYRRAYDDKLIKTLLQADYGARYRDTIPDLVRLALLTGARLEVFCAMKKAALEKRADGYWATIEGDKTEAGNRTIPLHSAATGLLRRRLAAPGDYLFEGLEPGGPDKKRSWYVGKMFRYHKTKAGVKEQGQDFHAFRNTFIACMEGHEVPESTVKLLVGHKRQSLTFGHYSKGERVKLREAIEKLDYGPEIMGLIERT